MLTVATNLTVSDIADPAFLRRMGYRLHLNRPDEPAYTEILRRYASRVGADLSEQWIAAVLRRYRDEDRELRCSEPRDLVERCREICDLHGREFELTEDVLDMAWTGYFGNT
jgi:SpoVK/Ycf46/Vps4 family AAA+-type ATPase